MCVARRFIFKDVDSGLPAAISDFFNMVDITIHHVPPNLMQVSFFFSKDISLC